jgi:AraC-like DNA-binding protein
VVNDGPRGHLHRVLPDGCVDLVWIGDSPPVVAGPATRWTEVPLPPRAVVVGVRLRPGSPALGVPASALRDREVRLRELWGSAAADELTERLAGRGDPGSKLAALEQALVDRWVRLGARDPRVAFAVRWLLSHPGGRVSDLASALGVSGRHLHRRFAAGVGYGPKTFQRIVRFQRLLAAARRSDAGRPELGALALALGYADQAHMTRELARLAGRTPGAALGRTGSTLTLLGPLEGLSETFKTEGAGGSTVPG